MMPNERRLSIRKPLDQLAYLRLPADNGGIVLDVSEGGLGFHAISPVEMDGPIEFRFEIDSDRKITAVGELAWKDAAGKNGGLRFTRLSDEVRGQIRQWADEVALKEAARSAARDVARAISTVIEASVAPSPNGAKVAASGKPEVGCVASAPVSSLGFPANNLPDGAPEAESAKDAPTAAAEDSSQSATGGNARPAKEMNLEGTAPTSLAKTRASSEVDREEFADLAIEDVVAAMLSEVGLSGHGEVPVAVKAPPAPVATETNGAANGAAEAARVENACVDNESVEPKEAVGPQKTAPNGNSRMNFAMNVDAPPAGMVEAATGRQFESEFVVHVPAAGPGDGPERNPITKSAAGTPAVIRCPLLYNRTPPVYSAPFYSLSMFPLDIGPKPRQTVPEVLQFAVVRHPVAAVAFTAVLAFLVSVGIFSYVCTTPVGDAFASWGAKIWGNSPRQLPVDPEPPARAPATASIPRQR